MEYTTIAISPCGCIQHIDEPTTPDRLAHLLSTDIATLVGRPSQTGHTMVWHNPVAVASDPNPVALDLCQSLGVPRTRVNGLLIAMHTPGVDGDDEVREWLDARQRTADL